MSYEYSYKLDKDTLSVVELQTGKVIPDLNALSYVVDVSHLTFRDLFKFVIKNDALKAIISVLAKCNIDAFMGEFDLSGNTDKELTSIHISRVEEYTKFGKYTDWSESWINVAGKAGTDPINYAIEGLNISTILDLPVIVDNYVYPLFTGHKDIFKSEASADCFSDTSYHCTLGPYQRGISLEEILRSLFYEISWFGTPENRDTFMKNLSEDVKKLDG